jgi:hypothetical protein
MKTWMKNNWEVIVVTMAFLLWCHIVLSQDQDTLCSNEATAYSECSE